MINYHQCYHSKWSLCPSVCPSVCAPLHLFHLWNVLIKPNPPHLPNDGLTNWMTDWMRTTCLLSLWINKHLNSLNICRKYLDFVCLEWKWQIFYEATRPAYNPSVCLSIPLCQHPLQWNNSDNDKRNKKRLPAHQRLFSALAVRPSSWSSSSTELPVCPGKTTTAMTINYRGDRGRRNRKLNKRARQDRNGSE